MDNLINKNWRVREITIGEFEDVWKANNRLEIAPGLLISLKNIRGIFREDKVDFLVNNILLTDWYYFGPIIRGASAGWPTSSEWRRKCELQVEVYKTALSVFFELVPVWDDESFHCASVLNLLSFLPSEVTSDFSGEIKKFIHSYLNTPKKEEVAEGIIIGALINNRMFKELVNYNFTSALTIDALWIFLFKEAYEFFPRWGPGAGDITDTYRARYKFKKISEALKENQEPHAALNILLRLLAKRGDLDKIFQVGEKENTGDVGGRGNIGGKGDIVHG